MIAATNENLSVRFRINGVTYRSYATANNAEFLAVVSEFFFESPDKMKVEHPDLYSALNSFYNPKVQTKN